jgi:DNA-directed RNA polymerase subunit RPC12/RpoP
MANTIKDNQGNQWAIIKCPHCGYEYIPAEIFVPDQLLGKAKTVIKDALGKILYVEWKEGEEPVLTEKYVCDNCDETFLVTASLNYKVEKEAVELDFKNQSVSLLDD